MCVRAMKRSTVELAAFLALAGLQRAWGEAWPLARLTHPSHSWPLSRLTDTSYYDHAVSVLQEVEAAPAERRTALEQIDTGRSETAERHR